MAGRKGRSGGHNRLSAEEHLLRGTFNVTRHGPRPAALATAVMPRAEPVPADVSEGLSGRGLTFVRECWSTYSGWTASSRVLLREAGQLVDQLDTLRGQRGERAAQRLLLATLAALRLED
jgi:hypothetical protein